MLRPGDILDEKYKIIAIIGRGGMSKVWLARDLNLTNKSWAVKEIDKTTEAYKREVRERETLNEIEIMKKLDHPMLPRIVSVINKPSSICVVMDYIEGETLYQILSSYGPQPEERVVSWSLSLCDALDYMHRQDPPIIYRDMKPENAILTPDGNVKIVDFGIARERKGNKRDTIALGTEGYYSPEHKTGNTDARSDVYTLGVTIYHLLTDKDPRDPPYKILPIREIDPTLSTGLEKIIIKATQSDPEDRYQTIAEMADAIASYKKLEEGYIEDLRTKIKRFSVIMIAGLIALGLGMSLLVSNTIIQRQNYATLMSLDTTNQEQRISDLKQAAELKPRAAEPYTELIKVYSRDGKFTESEAAEFLSVFNSHKESLERDPENYADISYQIGEAFLKFYTGSTDNSARAKLLAAEPYFKNACIDGYSKASLAKGYVFMADYYTNYILADDSLIAKDASGEEYQKLLLGCSDIISELDSYNGNGASKMRAITYELILNLLDTEKDSLAKAGIDKGELASIISQIETKAANLSEEDNKKEILNQCNSTKEGIERVYLNLRKKEG